MAKGRRRDSKDDQCRAILQWGTNIKKLIAVTTCNYSRDAVLVICLKQKLLQKFGGFTEKAYICTKNREMEYKLH